MTSETVKETTETQKWRIESSDKNCRKTYVTGSLETSTDWGSVILGALFVSVAIGEAADTIAESIKSTKSITPDINNHYVLDEDDRY